MSLEHESVPETDKMPAPNHTESDYESPSPEGGENLEQLRKAARLTGLLGVVFAVLFLSSLWYIHRIPGYQSEESEYLEFYESRGGEEATLVGLYVLPISAVAFIWFMAALRQWVIRNATHREALLGTVQILAGVTFIALVFASAAASTVTAISIELKDQEFDVQSARLFPTYGDALRLVFAMRMVAMFIMTTTSIGRKTYMIPGWFQIISIVVALVLFLSATLSIYLVVLFPIWIIFVSLLCFLRPNARIQTKGDLQRVSNEFAPYDCVL